MSTSYPSELWLNPASQSYSAWIRRFDTLDESAQIVLRRSIRNLKRQPLISVILPVYNPKPEELSAAVASVRGQLYPNWELCLTDDCSPDPAVYESLEKVAAGDQRIRVCRRDRNGGIAACSNTALALARGAWIALLDQDDLLTEHALALVAGAIEQYPEGRLFYSDEDKIDQRGERTEPYFKSDWNPQLFLVQNFISHLGVYARDLVEEIGGFREGFEGSQDYDLALRFIEKLQPEQIVHLPRILYHWRKTPGSLAMTSAAKMHAHDSARRALTEHLGRTGIRGQVVPCPENPAAHRIIYDLPERLPSVSIVIPTRDQPNLLRRCVETLFERTHYAPFDIVIVDNGSVDETTLNLFQELRQNPRLTIVSSTAPFNFSALINFGVAQSGGELVVLMNDDMEAQDSDWLKEMVAHVSQPSVGAVGARLWFPDGTLQHGGVILGFGGVAGHAHYRYPATDAGYFSRAFLQQNFSAVTAACMIIRREAFEQVNGMDEVNLPVAFNDIDFCLRLREHGWQVRWTPSANLLHHESASRGRKETDERDPQSRSEVEFMLRRWNEILLRDPFYNVNLSLRRADFALSWPPRIPLLAQLNSLTE